MEGIIAIWAMIWWIFAIINIVFCVLTRKRYKKLGWKGSVKRIILSWVIIIVGIFAGSALSVVVDSRDPKVSLAVVWITCYVFSIIAIMYTSSAANKAKTAFNVANNDVNGENDKEQTV